MRIRTRAAPALVVGLGPLVLLGVAACNQLFGIEDANAVDAGAVVDGAGVSDARTEHAPVQGGDSASTAGAKLGSGPFVFAFAGTSVAVAAAPEVSVGVERGVVTSWVYKGDHYTQGTLSAQDVGGGDEIIWGRWAGGTAGSAIGFQRTILTVAPNGGIHWVVGSAPFGTFPSAGAVDYALIGSTSPTRADGTKMPGTVAGTAKVTFTGGMGATISLSLTITIPGDATYVVKTPEAGPSPFVVKTPPLVELPARKDALTLKPGTGSVCSGLMNCFPDPNACQAAPPCPVWITGVFAGARYQRLAFVVQLSPDENYGSPASITTVVVFGAP
ncbi:MAG: hypothetical protein JWO86_385 [Myxococcaceae bacterium]|nr:hypothetical protein [Myxococcaceae bacterium]